MALIPFKSVGGYSTGRTGTTVITDNGGLCASGATFSQIANFINGLCASGGTFSGTQTFVNGATFNQNVSFLENVGIGRAPGTPKLFLRGATSNDGIPEIAIEGSCGTIQIHNSLPAGNYNLAIEESDKAIVYTQGGVDSGAFAIVPFSGSRSGIRLDNLGLLSCFGGISAAGNITLHGAILGSTLGTAPKFFARAWVNFNASSGTPVIRNSGNVSSIGDNGVGLFTINFATAMGNTGYASLFGVKSDATSLRPLGFVRNTAYATAVTTTALQITTTVSGLAAGACADNEMVSVAIFN